MTQAGRYAFGGFVLERAQLRVLRPDGTALDLSPRLFDALLLFVQRPGELLDKDLLIEQLWPSLVVEENNLSQVIHSLRRALGDDGRQFIQTVPRRGFRFIAPVTQLADDPLPAAVTALSAQAEGPPPAPRRRRMMGMAALVGLGAVAAGGWVWSRRPAADDHRPPRVTLAVLPFQALGPSEDELLGMGMAESLVARLSLMPGLVVRSMRSVERYGGGRHDPLKAARELDVHWVVDGSLMRHGDQLRATARLLRGSDGTSAWGGSFDQQLANVFDVQDHIAARIAHELAASLRPESAEPLPRQASLGGTRNMDAYQLYLMGRSRGQGGKPEDLQEAISLLQRALAVDPGFAMAWVQLAWTHRRGLWNIDAVPADVFRPANAALDRALSLVPRLPAARAGLAFSRYWFDYDWAGAESEFRAALAINPNDEGAHHGLGMLLATQDRIEEGLLHERTARELDPLGPFFNVMEASLLVDAGRLPEARTRLGRALELNPKLWLAHVCRALLHFALHEDDAGIAALRVAVEHGKGTSRPRVMLGVHLARLGRHDETRRLLRQLAAQARKSYVPPTALAALQAALGDNEGALASLELALAVRDIRLVYCKDDPHWKSLRMEPGFKSLLKRMKLDGYGRGLSPV